MTESIYREKFEERQFHQAWVIRLIGRLDGLSPGDPIAHSYRERIRRHREAVDRLTREWGLP